MYGLAIDLGTTNIAASLIDLKTKKQLSTFSLPNSQKKFGLDVITRLHFASTRSGVKTLQNLVIKDINHILDKFAKTKPVEKVFVVGNTIMLHFLFSLDASGFLAYPYRSKISTCVKRKASELGLNLGKGVIVESLPVISLYLGADLVAGFVEADMFNENNTVYSDLGTNAEIAVMSDKGVFAASAAAGPAFKSKLIPLGSELISKTADLLRKKYIDSSGKVLRPCNLEQRDIRSLQVAKAAIHSAIEILLRKAKIRQKDIRKVYIAGIFGDSLKLKDALKIKLFPAFPKAKVIFLGDAALSGAVKFMMTGKSPEELVKLVKKVKKVALNQEKEFQNLFLEAMRF